MIAAAHCAQTLYPQPATLLQHAGPCLNPRGWSYPQLMGHCVHDVGLPLEVELQAHLQPRNAKPDESQHVLLRHWSCCAIDAVAYDKRRGWSAGIQHPPCSGCARASPKCRGMSDDASCKLQTGGTATSAFTGTMSRPSWEERSQKRQELMAAPQGSASPGPPARPQR